MCLLEFTCNVFPMQSHMTPMWNNVKFKVKCTWYERCPMNHNTWCPFFKKLKLAQASCSLRCYWWSTFPVHVEVILLHGQCPCEGGTHSKWEWAAPFSVHVPFKGSGAQQECASCAVRCEARFIFNRLGGSRAPSCTQSPCRCPRPQLLTSDYNTPNTQLQDSFQLYTEVANKISISLLVSLFNFLIVIHKFINFLK